MKYTILHVICCSSENVVNGESKKQHFSVPAALIRHSILTWGRQLLEQSLSPFLLCSCSCTGCNRLLYLLVFSTAVSPCMACFTSFPQIFCLYSGEALCPCSVMCRSTLSTSKGSSQRGKMQFGQGVAEQTEVLAPLGTSSLYLVVEYLPRVCG